MLATVWPYRRGHRLVEIDRLISRPRQFGEDALRLAECVTEQHRCKAFRTILRPPLEDLGTRGAVRRPYILRRTEGRFGDEHIARPHLEWRSEERRVGRSVSDSVALGGRRIINNKIIVTSDDGNPHKKIQTH